MLRTLALGGKASGSSVKLETAGKPSCWSSRNDAAGKEVRAEEEREIHLAPQRTPSRLWTNRLLKPGSRTVLSLKWC